MSAETRSTLATAFAVLAAIVAFATVATSALVAVKFSHRIQSNRIEAIAANCRDVNERHDATIAKLDELVAKLPPAQRERAKAGRAGTILLIDTLAPKRPDCRAYARSIVRP